MVENSNLVEKLKELDINRKCNLLMLISSNPTKIKSQIRKIRFSVFEGSRKRGLFNSSNGKERLYKRNSSNKDCREESYDSGKQALSYLHRK